MDQPHDHHEEAPPPKMGKPLPWKQQLTLLGFCVALIVAGFVAVPAVVHAVSKPEAAQEEAPTQVENGAFKVTDKQWPTLKIQPVQDQQFQDDIETDGRIALDDDLATPVFSPYSGRVTRLIAKAGDTVKLGDPLMSIQASELAQAENDLITAVAGLKTAKAQLNLAQTNEKRQHDLYNAQGAALKDWQQAQVDLATAQGGYNGALIALAAVRSRLGILGQSGKEIDQIEASPDILKLSADTLVPAPIAGTIVQRQVGLGQNIVSAASGASSPIFTIGDVTKVWLVANAREESAPFLHVGNLVEVTVLAFPNRVFKARLTYVAAAMDPNTHRLPVRAEVENPNGELKPDMMASFRIITGPPTRAPAVPVSAVVYEGETQHVWIADPKNKTLAIRDFEAGHTQNGMVEAVSGLKAGDYIVTAGAVFIDRAVTGD